MYTIHNTPNVPTYTLNALMHLYNLFTHHLPHHLPRLNRLYEIERLASIERKKNKPETKKWISSFKHYDHKRILCTII